MTTRTVSTQRVKQSTDLPDEISLDEWRDMPDQDRPASVGIYLRFPLCEPQDAYIFAEAESLGAPVQTLTGVKLVDLIEAVRRLHCSWNGDPIRSAAATRDFDETEFMVYDIPQEDFREYARRSHDGYFGGDYSLFITRNAVRLRMVLELSLGRDKERLGELADSLLQPWSCSIHRIEAIHVGVVKTAWEIDFIAFIRGRTVDEVLRAANSLTDVLTRESEYEISQATALALLRAGKHDWMMNYPENEWFEAKSKLWNLSDIAGKVELAQDVARFANARGGLIVVGASTKRLDGTDTVNRIQGVKRIAQKRQIQAIVDHRVVPTVQGLEVFVVDVSNQRVLYVICVPDQAAGHWPFLVHGSIVDGKVEGKFFSIVQRRGEESIVIDAKTVHGWIARGRSLES